MEERRIGGSGFPDVVIPERVGYTVTVEPGWVVLSENNWSLGDEAPTIKMAPDDALILGRAILEAARWLEKQG